MCFGVITARRLAAYGRARWGVQQNLITYNLFIPSPFASSSLFVLRVVLLTLVHHVTAFNVANTEPLVTSRRGT